jgi:hypothetical protein
MPTVLWPGLGPGAVGAVASVATGQAGTEGVGVVSDPEPIVGTLPEEPRSTTPIYDELVAELEEAPK